MTVIRPARKGDAAGVMDVCWHTGFMGEDLEGLGRFNDRRLFGYLFCLYFVMYEIENCFVADDGGKVVGYVIGARDAAGYGRRFDRLMKPRIVWRMLSYTWWRHPESFREVMRWARLKEPDSPPPEGYPAFLHINLLDSHQRLGLGGGLVRAYEERLRGLGVEGIHLHTSSLNAKALPFYEKRGYEVLKRAPDTFWSGVGECEGIMYGKRLG
ncbi:MAG: GNAT family N-acetyltransferase [Spirochaetes bacterium]|nr:GNAT family N-acetyltransferase [Spirochaetota bacterium]MBU1082269.1 GNAT family N-acetyltransferase [Spirochaetota bacterium]